MSDENQNSDPSDDSDSSVAMKAAANKKRKKTPSTGKTKKRKKGGFEKGVSMIDDAAVLSGEESSDDDDEDGEENVNDYVRDGFVVDEQEQEQEQEEEKKKAEDGLEDSDDDDNGDGDDDDDDSVGGKRRPKGIRKMRDTDRLDDDDMDLINEARGITGKRQEVDNQEEKKRNRIKAKNTADLRKGLFDASDDEGATTNKGASAGGRRQGQRQVETFDEDGMDDFIEYDENMPRDRYRDDEDNMIGNKGISEAQLNEANDIFGTDFADFMAGDNNDEEDFDEDYADGDQRSGSRRSYRERGVGVDMGMDSDEFADESSDDDIFASDDDEANSGLTAEQRAEALRLKKEKRQLKKDERRKAAAKKKSDKRKANLRRAFEPVQLVENFCTERDDEIRSKDVPERFFDWSTPFHGPAGLVKEFSLVEEEEAEWIIGRIPAIQTEHDSIIADFSDDVKMDNDGMDEMEKKQRNIVTSIIQALRYMHREKLEPDFIRKYREDYVISPAVRANLYAVMDEDTEWERVLNAKTKVNALLEELLKIAESDDALGADEDNVAKLKEDLMLAQERLDESVQQELNIKNDIGALDNDEDDDDDLFGDDDEEDKEKNEAEKTKKKDSFEQHLKTTRSLMAVCAEQLTQTAASLKIAEEKSVISNPGQRNAVDTSNKVCKDKLWNAEDYKRYVTNLKDHRQVMDVYKYLSLIKEGTDAVRTKNALTVGENDKKKRSRRFDRDYYRTCVSQGLRAISYQFALSPFRAGIKLEDNMTLAGGFNWDKNIAGESTDDMYDVGPRKWDAPTVHDSDPSTFASDLVSSGELVLMASMNKGGPDDSEVSDPLRGCRYVAAMELSHEPRIRKQLREIYRANAVLSTRPTSKGLENIDPFHELYGLHLLRNKSVKDHFPVDNQALQRKMAGLDTDERTELDAKIKSIERDSCIQYMNILKAERSGHVKYHVHLPFVDGGLDDDSWYKQGDDYFNSREKQDFALLMNELEKIYLPTEPDTEEWNEERNKIIRFALINFLLPQFEAELKRDLRTAAVKVGINAAGKNLKAMALEGPYRPSHLLGENRFLVPTGDLPIVGVCCSSDGREASYLAAVSERGELVDNLAIPSGTQVDGDKMRDKVITFLMQSRPSAIVVGSLAGLPCRLVARKLGALATQATEKWNNRGIQAQDEDDDEYDARMEEFRRMYPDDVEDDEVREEWKCNVEMVDDNVAQLFGRSVRGKKEFPDSPINLKCAISIARHAKDPLAELTYTWGVASDAGVFGTEMLYLNIHPLQQYLPKSMLLREYERVLSGAVAEVGADLNLSCKYDHLHGLLTFVAGLGPRKAASLKHSMDRLGGVIASRKDVLVKRMAGPIVYNNAIAFLRIRDIDALSNQFLHPLDDTRLHPDVYIRNSWATKIAIDALEMDNGDNISNADRDDRAIKGIRDIMQNSRKEIKRLYNATKEEWERSYGHSFNVGGWDPKINVPSDSWRDKVDELDLETFADIIESSNQGKWLSHLTTIKWEFRLPFEDPRKPMDPLDREKLFRLLTGETDQTLCPGKEVTGKVARISDFGAHLKLEGDVPAFIPLRNLADGHVESAEDVVQIGTIVTAIVTEVKKDHMSVDLSLKMEDFRKDPNTWERPPSLPPLDQAFDSVAAANIEKGKSKVREERLAVARIAATGEVGMTGATTSIGRSKRVTRRACAHPAFRNSTSNEISKELKDGGELMVGEALIRPSSKNAESLAVHWLVRPGVIKVVEVLEEDKDNDASIGNTLKIKDEAYGSIDELLARFIAPMNERVEELTTYRKFLHFSEADVDEKLRDMKKENAEGVFYFLCWNEKFPGYASLRFIFNTPRDHAIGITPDGFSWSKKMYPNLDALINAFKKNPRGAVSVASSRQSANSSLRSVDTSKSSRWGGRSTESSVPRPPPGAPTWNTAPRPLPPASLPPPPQQGYRPAPPSLPPPPQHSYPPAPPGGYQRQ